MENLKDYQLNKKILCIDLKSFYASVECVLRGLDPFTTPLVVADKSIGEYAIVLAVTPYLKQMGVSSRCRVKDLPKDIDIIFARPQMAKYMEYSTKVVDIYLDFVSEEDLYVYSVDEAFLDLTHYLSYYKMSAYEIAIKILNEIYHRYKLTATCGIGPNMLLAKVSMDIEAKKTRYNIAEWTYDDVERKLHKIEPLSKMWGIGHRMEHNLNLLGIFTIGDLAKYDKNKLKSIYGIMGLELWYHANGIDMSLIQEKGKLRNNPKSFGTSQVLPKTYNAKEIYTIILEMTDEVTRRLRLSKKVCKTIGLMIGDATHTQGFSRQLSLDMPTSSTKEIFETCLLLFDLYYENYPIKNVGIQLSNLSEQKYQQLSLFEDVDTLEKTFNLEYTLDKVKQRFGKNKVLRATSLEEHATAKKRNEQVGGHHV
jgi:DNA polymerase V